MPDHDLRVCQQWGKMFRITLIVEDRGLQRRLDLGENARRDRGGEIAEKQGFHGLPSPTHDGRAIVAFRLALAKGLEVAHGLGGARTKRGARPMANAISIPWQTAPPRIPTGVNRKRAARRWSM